MEIFGFEIPGFLIGFAFLFGSVLLSDRAEQMQKPRMRTLKRRRGIRLPGASDIPDKT